MKWEKLLHPSSSFETAVEHNAQMCRLKREPFELSPNINGIIYRYLLQLFIKEAGGGAAAGEAAGQTVRRVVQLELPSMSHETVAFLFFGGGGCGFKLIYSDLTTAPSSPIRFLLLLHLFHCVLSGVHGQREVPLRERL